jgi:hypothetical protein
MSTAFVLGNGISRKNIAPANLQPLGKIYGCNALYREFIPDVLVATDRPIATAIQESGYAKNNQFYTRRPIDGLNARRVPIPYFGYSSGPIATAIAAQDGHRLIYLLGFDMGPTNNNQFNNVYAGTEFYKSSTALPTFTGNWVKQLIHIIKDFPNVEFVRICGATTAHIPQFDAISNLKLIELSTFLNQIIATNTDRQ